MNGRDDTTKIYIMTDMEGISGVINFEDWVVPGGCYYERGKQFTTEQVNAAIEGFILGGADEIDVIDGHGSGGIDISLLDPRVSYIRGTNGPYPFALSETYDGIAWIGQHAKAGTPYAHLAHTGSFNVAQYRINGISVGEFGTIAFLAASFNVTPFFATGDVAFCAEARSLCPDIRTVSVKQGLDPETGDNFTTDEYSRQGLGAKHIAPALACKRIQEAAKEAVAALPLMQKKPLTPLSAPYELKIDYRTDKPGEYKKVIYKHPDSLVDLLNNSLQS